MRSRRRHLLDALWFSAPELTRIDPAQTVTNYTQLFAGLRMALVHDVRQTLHHASGTVSVCQDAGKEHLVPARTEPVRKRVQGRVSNHKAWNQQNRTGFRRPTVEMPCPSLAKKPCKFSDCAKFL